MAPIRIQRKRTKGWRMPEGTVYVGRPTIWSNPFKVFRTDDGLWTVTDTFRLFTDEDRHLASALATDLFEIWLLDLKGDKGRFRKHRTRVLAGIAQLRGRDLACWCKEGNRRHADVLLELANR